MGLPVAAGQSGFWCLVCGVPHGHGLFDTARIALNDNLLSRASEEGVEAVMAHEIGRYLGSKILPQNERIAALGKLNVLQERHAQQDFITLEPG